MNKKIFGLLGLASKSRNLAYGETAFQAIRSKNAKLVVLSNDCSCRTKKQILDKCKTYKISVIIVDSSLELSNAVGKVNIVFIAVLDEGFTKMILKENSEMRCMYGNENKENGKN
ncbi:MAG: L7Ae/L30e/S12e/Gadd45 family ribosomal protein [Anaerorhabdus sp.]